MTVTHGAATAGVQPIACRAEEAMAPMSHAQELLWLIDRASPGHTAYNVPRALRLVGTLDESALRRALNGLVARHEVLRSTYETRAEQPVQVVHPATPVDLAVVDLRAVRAVERAAAVQRELRERAAYHFDLARETPFRAALLRLGDAEHVLFLLTHHICSDGWAKAVLFRDLGALYAAFRAGHEPALPPLPIQYADYAAWERAQADGDEQRRQLAYWRERLQGPLPALQLPTDRPRTAAPGAAAAACALILPRATLDGLRRLGQTHDATLYMVLLATYHTLLHRYTAQDDIITGSPIANRNRSETEGLLGLFANTLVMRSRLGDDPTFSELLRRVSDDCLDAFDNSELPLERLVLELQRQGAITQPSLFQAVLTMEDTVAAEPALDGLTVTSEDVGLEQTKFDLTLLVREQGDGLRLTLYYRTDLHDAATAERMLGHFRMVAEGAVADPSRRLSALPLLTTAERAQLDAWNATPAAAPVNTLPDLIDAATARHPTRVAVASGTERITYAELEARATALGARLAELGAGPAAPVALTLERSAAMIVALVAAWKAGAPWVALLPDLPPARYAALVKDAGVQAVVTTAAHAGLVPPGIAVVALDRDWAPASPGAARTRAPALDDVAYGLFTSGSTGAPKGVAVTHANLAAYTTGVAAALGVQLQDVAPLTCATVSTLAADLGHTAIFLALASGGTLHVVPEAEATDGARFAAYVAREQVDLLKITPNHLQALLAVGGDGAFPRHTLVLGGEATSWDLVERAARHCRVFNHYGPTETTVGCCVFPIAQRGAAARAHGAATVPIGLPLPGASARVLDAKGNEQPIGIPGELHVGGLGVSRGYLNRDDLTAERFLPDTASPRPEARMYRTGDRVRRLPTGDLEFLGRTDFQVKVRGYRVEPGEIEAVLLGVAGVRQAAVVLRDDALVAYVAGDADQGVLVAAARAMLPPHMVPATVVRLEALPLNANGKVDRAALPTPGAGPAPAVVEPRTPTEERIAAIWAEVLKKGPVGVTDSFIELGGHSLMAIRILGRLSKEFGVRLPLRALFEQPTVAALAAAVDAARAPSDDELLAALARLPEDAARQLLGDARGEGARG